MHGHSPLKPAPIHVFSNSFSCPILLSSARSFPYITCLSSSRFHYARLTARLVRLSLLFLTSTMFYTKNYVVFTLVLQFLQLISAGTSNPAICKASLGSPDWPTLSQWAALNASISGRLLQPPPPGAVCHPDQPTYNAAECPTVLTDWYSIPFHVDNPISSAWNNWNNDSCLPTLPSPCSGEGYPVYVINATCKEDVKAGIDFARKNNVRLNVKSSGHDYMGRFVILTYSSDSELNPNLIQVNIPKFSLHMDTPLDRTLHIQIFHSKRM
jgi:hypothetical protein